MAVAGQQGTAHAVDTEIRLRDWRLGQIAAERLSAGLLRISGYVDVDPQAPLGGPDGKKDIVAWRAGKKYIAACYFPATPVTFADITRKYRSDYAGVATNGGDGFIFFVNQMLTVSQRAKLVAFGNDAVDEIFHLERIRGELDGPRGYGLRLEYLQIPMSPEEQVSYFNTLEQDTVQRLIKNEVEPDWAVPAIARLDVSLLQMLHEIMLGPFSHGGLLRAMAVYVADGKGGTAYKPPPPHLIRGQLQDHCAWWRKAYGDALTVDRQERLQVLARLHHGIVSVMPFADGNGRLARHVTHLAARELLGRGVAVDLTTDRHAYHEALRQADGGSLVALTELIRASLISPR
jgi:fido (protein-threonine AMPylation protein)